MERQAEVELSEGESTVVWNLTPSVQVTYVKRHVWASGNPAVEVEVDEVPPSGNPMNVFLDPGGGLLFDTRKGGIDLVWLGEDAEAGTARFRLASF